MKRILLVLGGLVAVLLAWRRTRRSKLPAMAVIVSPKHSTTISEGAVRSAQSAELTFSRQDLDWLWNPTNLENLARTYWRFLSRVTLGLIRVVYGDRERRVVLLVPALTLLRFEAPEYVMEPDCGKVSWQIRDGLLVARSGRGSGYLALEVRRVPVAEPDRAKLHIEVEVANFYPSIAASFSTPAYRLTQAVIHVLVTHNFLRSLASLELAESKVGRLARAGDVSAADTAAV